MHFKGRGECAALAPSAMHTSPPQSWLTTAHVSKATAMMAGRWDYFKAEKSSLAVAGKSQLMVFIDRWCALRNHCVSLILFFNLPFLLTSLLAWNLICFPTSYLSHFLFTYLFQSLSVRSWFKFGFRREELFDVENWGKPWSLMCFASHMRVMAACTWAGE